VARAKRDGEYKYLNVSLPVDLLKRLDDYYDKSRFNKNTIVEFALAEYLDKMQTSDKK
jgi:metal-responsive CopG/Arc/MetJ family transcriptional regulator